MVKQKNMETTLHVNYYKFHNLENEEIKIDWRIMANIGKYMAAESLCCFAFKTKPIKLFSFL